MIYGEKEHRWSKSQNTLLWTKRYLRTSQSNPTIHQRRPCKRLQQTDRNSQRPNSKNQSQHSKARRWRHFHHQQDKASRRSTKEKACTRQGKASSRQSRTREKEKSTWKTKVLARNNMACYKRLFLDTIFLRW